MSCNVSAVNNSKRQSKLHLKAKVNQVEIYNVLMEHSNDDVMICFKTLGLVRYYVYFVQNQDEGLQSGM